MQRVAWGIRAKGPLNRISCCLFLGGGFIRLQNPFVIKTLSPFSTKSSLMSIIKAK